ncbi:MAG: COX15/CtaA family protein [Bacteroidia bacterium]
MKPLIQFLKSERFFLRFATFTLISLYLVILAGSVVRATGSGMGCPDWPKCFGFFIPPTNPSDVYFQSNETYGKGRLIIVNDTLWRATADFVSGENFARSNWEKYPQHNYAKFIVKQTWIEYINRLLGALSDFSTLILLCLSLFRFRKDMLTSFLLVFGIFVLAFVGWLGKVVVDTNLKPLTISRHMFSAMIMVAIIIFVQQRIRKKYFAEGTHEISSMLRLSIFVALVLTVVQILAGVMVRQQIDTMHAAATDTSMRGNWIGQLDGKYLMHQLIALLTILYTAALFYLLRKSKPQGNLRKLMYVFLILVVVEYSVGVFMHNFSIPAFAQPLHLILVHLIFGVQFALLMKTSKTRIR